MKRTRRYTRRVRDNLKAYRPHIYEGKEGALRLAREYGHCLIDSPKDEVDHELNNAISYNDICVIGYNLSPPLDVNEWQEEVKNAYESAREKRERNE